MNDTIRDLLFALLRRELNAGGADPFPSGVSLKEGEAEEVLRFSARFDLSHLIGDLLLRENVPMTEETRKKCGKSRDLAVYRCLLLQQAQTEAYAALEGAGIPFLPLKGAVLRDLYPAAWMRTSCDIDVLLHPEDTDRAVEALKAAGWSGGERHPHEISLYAGDGTHLELHYDLVEEGRANNARSILSRVWEHASPAEGGARYALDDEMFCFYHCAHMAKHLEIGGCGVRSFLDLWILKRAGRWCVPFREEDCLTAFAERAEALAGVWMDGEPRTEASERLERFILAGGTYGTQEQHAAVSSAKLGSRAKQVFSRVFPPYGKMKIKFPILEKHPILTPVMHVVRWFNILFRKKNKTAAVKSVLNVSRTDVEEAALLLKDLGLAPDLYPDNSPETERKEHET